MFEKFTPAPPDAILGLTEAFKQDPNPNKINLGVGIYKDAQGRTPILKSVKQAEERLAAFLLNLTQRLHARGFSSTSLVLRMTREEIGSYLGLKLETVSRAFSKFQEDGVLEVKQRQITVLDPARLRELVGSAAC